MHIHLTPQYRTDTLSLEKVGETLVVNGVGFDLSAATEEASLVVDCPWIIGPVARENGQLVVTFILPHGEEAPTETLFPVPITMTGDGPVPLPPPAIPEEYVEEECED